MVAKSSSWLKPYKRMGCLPPTGAGTLPKMCASLMPRHLIQCLTGHVAHLRLQWAPAQDDSMKILVEIENLGAGIPGLGLKTRTPSTKINASTYSNFQACPSKPFQVWAQAASFIEWKCPKRPIVATASAGFDRIIQTWPHQNMWGCTKIVTPISEGSFWSCLAIQ